MRNPEAWRPTKYRTAGRTLRADPKHVGYGSRLIGDLIGEVYSTAIPRYCRGRLLDLGCGHVPLYEAYRGHVEDVTCVDWASSAHPNPHLDITHDITRPLPLDDASFDTIILSDVLEHIPTPEPLWDEMCRVLRPQGHLLLNVPFYYRVHEEPHDYLRYTEFALRRFAEARGLTVLELRPVGGTPEILFDILGKHVAALPFLGRVLGPIVGASARRATRVWPMTLLTRVTRTRFPFFYFLVAQKPAPRPRGTSALPFP